MDKFIGFDIDDMHTLACPLQACQRDRFSQATRFIHIGDTDVDRHYAKLHGFEFYLPDGLPADGTDGWIF